MKASIFFLSVVENVGIKSRLAIVKLIKLGIKLTSKDQTQIDHKYEQIYLLAKKITSYWQENWLSGYAERKQMLPILKNPNSDQRAVDLARLYYVDPSESMKRAIFVLAAGKGVRWERSHLKQLAIVRGKPLIEHILDAVPSAKVVTHHPLLKHYPHVVPSRHKYVLETIMSTHNAWGERTIILLGDTLYDPSDLAKILAFDGEFAVFGSSKQVEIFAISFSRKVHAKIVDNLCTALVDACSGGRGKIWEMYHSYTSMPLYKVGVGKYFEELYKTTDVDTINDYEIVVKGQRFKQNV